MSASSSSEAAGSSLTTVESRLRPPPGDDKEVVRDFIERLVSAMLHADIDDTSVNRLYKDPECKFIVLFKFRINIEKFFTNQVVTLRFFGVER